SFPMGDPADLRRRSLLALLGVLPAFRRLKAQNAPLVDAEFHLHPHYRARTPFDDVLLKTRPGSDEFLSEVEHDRIAGILAQWTDGLRQSPRRLTTIERVMSQRFRGCSLVPASSRIVRPGAALEVREVTLSPQPVLDRDAFLRDLRSSLG